MFADLSSLFADVNLSLVSVHLLCEVSLVSCVSVYFFMLMSYCVQLFLPLT